MFIPNSDIIEVCILGNWIKTKVIDFNESNGWIELLSEGYPKYKWNAKILFNHMRNIEEKKIEPVIEKKKRVRRTKKELEEQKQIKENRK